MDDALLNAFTDGDARAVARLLRPLPEALRRAQADAIVELASTHRYLERRRWRRGVRNVHPVDDGERALADRQRKAIELALLGTAALKQLRTYTRTRRFGQIEFDPELTLAVLLDRRPSWLGQWADWIMADHTLYWPTVRALVRAGAIERSPRYFQRLMWAPGNRGAAQLLADDPELLERDVWVMLREQGDETLRAADDVHGMRWREAITTCVADGRMDRDRVLDLVLDVLGSDVNAHRAAWYTGLWKALAVTPAERATRAAGLRALLGAAAPPIVSFGLDELVRAGADVPPAELATVLAAPAKKTVLAALKLLDREPDPALVTIALGHEHVDVQRAVLDRLERWELTDAARDGLLRHLDLLAATQRPRAEALLNLKVPGTFNFAEPVDTGDIPAEIKAALNFGGPLPPAPVPGEPVLGEPIAPIETPDELADELVRELALEYGCGENERLLEAIMRHCDQPFDGPLAPLRSRLEELGHWSPESPTGVAAAWLRRRSSYENRAWTWTSRLYEQAERAARGEARPVLAAPTHAGDWIDPRVLVARLHEHTDEQDLAQALLRLAPDHRAEALEAARDAPGKPGALLRCALGGPPVDPYSPAATAALAAGGHTDVRVTVDADCQIELLVDGTSFTKPWFGTGPLEELLAAATPEDRHGHMHYGHVNARHWPARRDLACAIAIAHMPDNLGTRVNYAAGSLLETMLPATEPLCPLALRLAVLTLGSAAEDEHLLAVDLLIAGIEDGRIDALPPDDVALLKPNRLAARLTSIAAAGDLQRAIVREFLDAALERVPERPGPLLTLFDELCAQTNTGPRASRAHLATLKQKAAKALLAREHAPSEAEAQLALAARVRRAQRWIG